MTTLTAIMANPILIELALHLEGLFEVDDKGQLARRMVRFGASPETQGIALLDAPCSGKTPAVYHLLAGCPALAANETGAPRYLHVAVPAPVAPIRLARAILTRLGVPVRGSVPSSGLPAEIRIVNQSPQSPSVFKPTDPPHAAPPGVPDATSSFRLAPNGQHSCKRRGATSFTNAGVPRSE
ncbi:hypothetical protein LAZ29_02500 [Cereibacter sphaeroides]|uniref:hypothetical protein n=1 Tax=Cereibacter sphaeroides TaxID=1063 RepID=UPI001F198537|nr:hypothetical protein [Cereibacter sphaeroides]MCE6949793.1 hypothetical protein [Cereibacter sphaeroides]